MFFRILRFCVLCLVVVFSSRLRATADTIYWTELHGPTLRAASLDGSNVRSFVPDTQLGLVVEVDPIGAKIYWSDGDDIVRSSLNGTNVEVLVTLGRAPSEMAIDLEGGKLYWTGPTTDKIERMNLDGTGLETLVTRSRSANPHKIVVDPARNKMYWTQYGDNAPSIWRADLNGMNVELFQGSLASVTGLALDPASGNVYWTEPTAGIIRRSDPTGTAETILSGLAFPRILYIDVSSNQLYWSVDGNAPEVNKLFRGDLDAKNRQLVRTLNGAYHELATNPVTGELYWAMVSSVTVKARIERADLDGNNYEILKGGWLVEPTNVAVDLHSGRLYWRDDRSILSAPLSGTTLPREEVSVGQARGGITVDPDSGDIYWADPFSCTDAHPDSRIWRFDGSTTVSVVSGLDCPSGIAIDEIADKIYWIDHGIYRANLDGTGSELVLAVTPEAIALDPANEKLYLADNGVTIQSVNFDGTGLTDLVTESGSVVRGLALNPIGDRMYWAADSSVYSANTDGTDIVELVTGLDTPWGIAVNDRLQIEIPATSTWTFLVMVSCVLALGTALLRRRCRTA